MNQQSKRLTVRRIHRRKLFFEKCLSDWRERLNPEKEKRLRSVLWMAHRHLKAYPLELQDAQEAKAVIKGIGPHLADRLDSAWRSFSVELNAEPTLSLVQALKAKEMVRFDTGRKLEEENGERVAVAAKKVKLQTVECVGNEANSSAQQSIDSTADLRLDLDIELRNYDIILLVDNAEKSTRSKSVTDALKKIGVAFEMRTLPLGDYLWIGRCNATGHELVLSYLIERKRWDDLAKSIQDKRYEEQKNRLRRFSKFGRVILLIEKGRVELHGRMNDNILNQAVANSQIQDEFGIHQTDGVDDTAKYLQLLDRALKHKFNGVTLRAESIDQLIYDDTLRQTSAPTFAQFKSAFAKNRQATTIGQLFARQLTVCLGMTSQLACAVVSRYGSFRLLATTLRAQPNALDDILPISVSQRLSRFFS